MSQVSKVPKGSILICGSSW